MAVNANDEYFMAVVDLLQTREAIEKAIEELKTRLPGAAVSHCRFALSKIGDAMEKIYRDKPAPDRFCSCGCGRVATIAAYEGCS
jgi:hypothetical protein